MPRKYRSPSPVKKNKKSPKYLSRSRSRSPEYKNTKTRKIKKYYSDSESDESESTFSENDSESEITESDSEDEYSKKGKNKQFYKKETRREQTNKKEKKSRYESDSEEELSPRYNEKERKNKNNEKKSKKHLSNDDEFDLHVDEELTNRDSRILDEISSKSQNKKVRNTKNEKISLNQLESNENLNSGPPKYRVVSFNGDELTVRKLYTSNIGPKNSAQKAFNRMCDKLNEKMEITVEKIGDKSGKVMTYFFMKQELDPPIERIINGKKVVYRHKTISC